MNKVSDVKKDEKRGKRACKTLPWRNKNGNEKRVNQEFTLDRTTVSMQNKSNNSGWPHFQDEDFIVFCFKENGAFDVVKDGKPEAFELFDSGQRSPRPVIRKVSKDFISFSSWWVFNKLSSGDTVLNLTYELEMINFFSLYCSLAGGGRAEELLGCRVAFCCQLQEQ